MNPIDYSKQMQREREYFRDTIQKDRQASEKRVNDNEERHERIQDKQAKNFIEDKTDLEKSYQTNLSTLKEKTHNAIEEKNQKFNKKLAEERDAFTRASQSKSKDFDQRLNDIKSSYQTSFESEKDNHEHLTDVQKQRYNRNVNDLKSTTEERLKEYQDKVVGTGASLKDQYSREQHQLTKSHEDQLRKVYKDGAEKRNELKETVSSDMAKRQDVHQADIKHVRDYAKQQVDDANKNSENRVQNLASEYSHKNENLTESQRKEALKTNKEHQQQLISARRDFQDQIRFRDLKERRNDNGSGEFAKVAKAQQGKNEMLAAEQKIQNLQTQMKEVKNDFNERRYKDQDSFNMDLEKESAEATARMDKKVNQMNAEKLLVVANEREDSLEQITNREDQNRLSKESYERQIMVERNNANTRLKKLKENFNTSFKALEERSQQNIDQVAKTSNTDKADFIKKMNENRNNEVFEMKREFARLMDNTVADYEKRLANYQKDNENIKHTMDQKIQTVMDLASKEVESQRKLFDDRRTADLRSHQLLQDQKDNNHKQSIAQLNVNYEKRMNQLTTASDMKLKLITNDYENKLKALSASRIKDITEKDMAHQMELERTKMAYEDEKARVISQYENQLTSMKDSHREKMEEMKEYKRLS